ncbi:MAG: Gfo/Idh/MocA family oxidoreductase, partial [Pirellulales bacterium]|nr:Gfo/Idh/MocA family oxidoreductase [Pirellulales bacterium]
QHRDMVVAAAEQGVKGIYLEKPLCRTLKEADEMVDACKARGVKVAVSHQTRYSPKLPVIEDLLRKGAIGKLLEIRGRGKEDSRGGGEDLWVLGTHVLDMMHYLGGKPRWCFASVEQNGRPISKEDVVPGNEGIGLLAGDSVHAMYRLGDGVTGYFDSTRNASGRGGNRFGIRLYGTEGIVEMGTGYLGACLVLRDPLWSSGRSQKKWIPISSAGVGVDEPLEDVGLKGGNDLAVRDLIAAIEADRKPKSSIEDARVATEMIVAVFESQRQGTPVFFPLKNRENPLSMLAPQ